MLDTVPGVCSKYVRVCILFSVGSTLLADCHASTESGCPQALIVILLLDDVMGSSWPQSLWGHLGSRRSVQKLLTCGLCSDSKHS